MRSPNFLDGQFVSATTETNAFSQVATGIAELLDSVLSPGVFNLSSATFTVSNLTLTCDLADTAVLFESGVLAKAFGTTNGATSSVYTLDLASLVPSSGTVTAYIIASTSTIGINSSVISGPPPGNPDYDPTFTPYSGYLCYLDTIVLTASTTAPIAADGQFEIARVSLSQGTTSLPAPTIANVTYGGVPDVTNWASKQIVNAESMVSWVEDYIVGTVDFSVPGIVKFRNGLIFQWGTYDSGSGGLATITFYEPFPKAALTADVCENNALSTWTANYPILHGYYGLSAGSMVVVTRGVDKSNDSGWGPQQATGAWKAWGY